MANKENIINFIEKTTGYRFGDTVGTLKTTTYRDSRGINWHLRTRLAYFAVDSIDIEEIVTNASTLAWDYEALNIEKNCRAMKFQKLGTPLIRRYLRSAISKEYSCFDDIYLDEKILMEKVMVRMIEYKEEPYSIGILQNWIGYAHLYLYALLMLNERPETQKYRESSFLKYAAIPCNEQTMAKVSSNFHISSKNGIAWYECNDADVFAEWNQEIKDVIPVNTELEYVFS